MQQEIAERMDVLAAQRGRHGKRALINDGSSRRGSYGAHVADRAADLIEQLRAGLRV